MKDRYAKGAPKTARLFVSTQEILGNWAKSLAGILQECYNNFVKPLWVNQRNGKVNEHEEVLSLLLVMAMFFSLAIPALAVDGEEETLL